MYAESVVTIFDKTIIYIAFICNAKQIAKT